MNLIKPNVFFVAYDQTLSKNFLRLYSLLYNISLIPRTELLIEKIHEQEPDVIILSINTSENINGLIILESYMSNPKFNSIPIISLVEDDVEEYIELVLEKGATDYVTKSRFFNLIRYKINSLMRIKKNVSNNFNHYKDELKNDLITDDHDQEIISKFTSEVENIIENDKHISINQIAKNLNISLTFLEKKVKLAFGKGPRRYILDKRLEKADFLLKSKKTSIKNIAFEIGFNSTAYFTKCYRLKYGKTPKSTKIDFTHD